MRDEALTRLLSDHPKDIVVSWRSISLEKAQARIRQPSPKLPQRMTATIIAAPAVQRALKLSSLQHRLSLRRPLKPPSRVPLVLTTKKVTGYHPNA